VKQLKWWLGAESNRRHKDFQSSALPTELPSQLRPDIQLTDALIGKVFQLVLQGETETESNPTDSSATTSESTPGARQP